MNKNFKQFMKTGKAGLHYSSRIEVHSYNKKKNKIELCGLGGMGIGIGEFEFSNQYLNYSVCTGCIQHSKKPQFSKKGKLKDFI